MEPMTDRGLRDLEWPETGSPPRWTPRRSSSTTRRTRTSEARTWTRWRTTWIKDSPGALPAALFTRWRRRDASPDEPAARAALDGARRRIEEAQGITHLPGTDDDEADE